jgi:hypothetical protein
MKILARDGTDVLDRWQREATPLAVEIVGAHVFVSFRATVASHSRIEIVLTMAEGGEASISLFGGTANVLEPTREEAAQPAWREIARVVQIHTDGGAQCTLVEARTGA